MPSSADVDIRPTTPDDLEPEHAAFAAAQRDLHDRHDVPWSPQPVERFVRVHRHLLDRDGERSFVARVDGRVVGFSAALVREDTWYLSALFVHPNLQGQGVGRELLRCSWGDGFTHRITITEAIQPISTGLYAGRGLIPATPILVLAGEPTITRAHSIRPSPMPTRSPSSIEPPTASTALSTTTSGRRRRSPRRCGFATTSPSRTRTSRPVA